MATANNPPFKRFKMVPIDGPTTAPTPKPTAAQPTIIVTKEANVKKIRTPRKRQPTAPRLKMPKAPSRKRLNDWFVDLKRMATARELVEEARVQTRIDDILNLAQGTSADDKLRMIQALSFATTKEQRNLAPVIAAAMAPATALPPTPVRLAPVPMVKPPELAIVDPTIRAVVAAAGAARHVAPPLMPPVPIPRLIAAPLAPEIEEAAPEALDRALVPYVPPTGVAVPEGEPAAPILPEVAFRKFDISDMPDYSKLKSNAQKFVGALRHHSDSIGVEQGGKRVVIGGRPIAGSDIGEIFKWIYPYGTAAPKEGPPTGTIEFLTYAFHTLNIAKTGMMRPKIIKDFFTFQVATGMSPHRYNRIIGYVPRSNILLNRHSPAKYPRTKSLNQYNIFKTIRV